MNRLKRAVSAGLLATLLSVNYTAVAFAALPESSVPVVKKEVIEVSATVKSVFNYVNKTKSKNKNNNAFFHDEARIKSSTTRSISAIKQIRNAVFILKKQNKQVSINAVNKITNQDKRTIKKYLNDILTTIENKEQNNNKLLPIMTVIENSVSKNELITPIHNNTS